MTDTMYDPDPDKPYGHCVCGAVVQMKDDLRPHFDSTKDEEPKQKHSVRISNPPREDRIERELERLVDDAIGEAMDQWSDEIERGHMTEEEVTAAAKKIFDPDLAEAWKEYNS